MSALVVDWRCSKDAWERLRTSISTQFVASPDVACPDVTTPIPATLWIQMNDSRMSVFIKMRSVERNVVLQITPVRGLDTGYAGV